MNRLLILSFLATVLSNFTAFAQDDCDAKAESHYDQRMCQGKRLEALDAKLNKVYKLALAKMPERDDSDNTKGQKQLRKSQRAWLTYYNEQCDLEGGLQGGSNSWVSTFAGECAEREIDSRIKFLQSIANGDWLN